ncbi:MAG: replication initiation protein [Pseudomonadota bacterium]
MKNEVTTLLKPNVTLVMVPRAGKITAIGRKLWNSILLSSANQLHAYRALHGSDPDNKHLYSSSATDLLRYVEVGKSNLKSALRGLVLALRRAEIDWEAPDAKSGLIWQNMNPLSQASFKLINGNLHVFWALPPELNTALSDRVSFPFTAVELEESLKLKSYTAGALYDVCARYRNNYRRGGDGECLTCVNPPDWWINILTNVPPKHNKLTGQPVLREWRKVKSESVKGAIEEINAETDLIVELLETKAGRAIGSVQFSVRQKKPAPREIPSSHFEQMKIGMRLGLGDSLIENCIANHSVEQVSVALAKLQARITNKELGPVENLRRYFLTILKDVDPFKVVEDVEVKPPQSPQSEAGEKQKQKSPVTVAKEEFMALSEAQKRVYGQRAVQRLTDRGLANDRILNNASEGVWSGVLLAEMVAIFTTDKSSEEITG